MLDPSIARQLKSHGSHSSSLKGNRNSSGNYSQPAPLQVFVRLGQSSDSVAEKILHGFLLTHFIHIMSHLFHLEAIVPKL